MLVIRLVRMGATNSPKYRIRVADSRKAPNGRFIENIGYFDPISKNMSVDKNKYESWLSKGAQPSSRVKSLYKKSV